MNNPTFSAANKRYSLLLLSHYVSIFLSVIVTVTSSSRFSSECLITRQFLPYIALTALGTVNTSDSYTLNYEIAKGFYSDCYDIQVSFITTEGTFQATNYLQRRQTNLQSTSELFKFAVVIPQDKICDVCSGQQYLNDDEVQCKIILKLIEIPTGIVTGYFEDRIILKTPYPMELTNRKSSSNIFVLFMKVRIIKFTPLVSNEGVAEHIFAYEMKEHMHINEERRKNDSRSSAVIDDNSSDGNVDVVEDQVQVHDYQVHGNITFKSQIHYHLETSSNAISYSLLNNLTEYSNDDEQLQQFKINNNLRLQLLNYPSTEIFSLKLGNMFLGVENQHGYVNTSNNNQSQKESYEKDIDLKDQSLIEVKQDDNDPFLITFQTQKDLNTKILPSFSIIQELIFYSKPTVLKQITISQFFQFNYSDNILQVIYLPSTSNTLTQLQTQSNTLFNSINFKNQHVMYLIVLGLFISLLVALVYHLRVIRNRLNIKETLKQTINGSNITDLERITIIKQ